MEDHFVLKLIIYFENSRTTVSVDAVSQFEIAFWTEGSTGSRSFVGRADSCTLISFGVL